MAFWTPTRGFPHDRASPEGHFWATQSRFRHRKPADNGHNAQRAQPQLPDCLLAGLSRILEDRLAKIETAEPTKHCLTNKAACDICKEHYCNCLIWSVCGEPAKRLFSSLSSPDVSLQPRPFCSMSAAPSSATWPLLCTDAFHGPQRADHRCPQDRGIWHECEAFRNSGREGT
jgi:hypothetical protein